MREFLLDYEHNPKVYDNDYLSTKSIERYYRAYFYDRRSEMDYTIKDKNYTIFDLLSKNTKSSDSYKGHTGQDYKWIMKQSFKEAGKRFEVIDNKDTIGLIVPYRASKEAIDFIKTSKNYKAIKRKLRMLQRYTVNLYRTDSALRTLIDMNAINNDLLDGTIYILNQGYYNEQYGVSNELELLTY